MVPGVETAKNGKVVPPLGDPQVLFPRAANGLDAAHFAGVALGRLAVLFGQVFEGDKAVHGVGRQRSRDLQGTVLAGTGLVKPGAFIAEGDDHLAVDRAPDPCGLRDATMGQRDHDAKGRLAIGEVAGAIDRVHDPDRGIRAQGVQHGLVFGNGFFAHDHGPGQDRRQRPGEQKFGFPIGDGDEV